MRCIHSTRRRGAFTCPSRAVHVELTVYSNCMILIGNGSGSEGGLPECEDWEDLDPEGKLCSPLRQSDSFVDLL